MPEQFSCCSSYRECSRVGNCIKKDNPEYDCCHYRKTLEAGKVFYDPKQKQLEGVSFTVKIGSRYFETGRYPSGQWYSKQVNKVGGMQVNVLSPPPPARIEKYYAVPVPKPNVLVLQDKKQVAGQMNIFDFIGG